MTLDEYKKLPRGEQRRLLRQWQVEASGYVAPPRRMGFSWQAKHDGCALYLEGDDQPVAKIGLLLDQWWWNTREIKVEGRKTIRKECGPELTKSAAMAEVERYLRDCLRVRGVGTYFIGVKEQ